MPEGLVEAKKVGSGILEANYSWTCDRICINLGEGFFPL